MFKKTINFVKVNKKRILRQGLIVTGTLVGSIIALGVIDSFRDQDEVRDVEDLSPEELEELDRNLVE